MKTILGHIANIQTGIFAKTVSKGDIVYLQAKHFTENGQLHSSLHPDLQADNITDKHLLRHGDVLFAAKGTKNFAAWYEGKNQPAVASTSFFVIRLTEKNILPDFLAWFINHPATQKILKGKAIGTSIVSISKSVLEELEISIPDLQTQKAILQITQLRNTEKTLMRKIETLREKQIQQQIINAIK
ncbi:MAG TPA: restriction endonuclease subunit S [Chitinophagaceae bacterium]|nr:restriction endonuclease subunit S [Chitinophagaceae bacterium]